jgi:hypothetical protein
VAARIRKVSRALSLALRRYPGTTNVDHYRFPRLFEYLARLPDGVDSYPDQVAKAAMYVDALGDRPLDVAAGDVPGPLLSLIRDPVAPTAWIPEVHMNAIFYAIADDHYGDRHVDEFVEWTFERNLHLLRSAWFRWVFSVLKPEWILRGVERRWSQFRRGTELRLTETRSGQCRMKLIYRPYLHDEDSIQCLGAALRAGAVIVGARRVTFDVLTADEVHADFFVTWE